MRFSARGASGLFLSAFAVVYPLATQAVGATGVKVAARDYGHDLEAMLAARATRDPRRLHCQPEQSDRHLLPGPEACLHSSRRSPRTCWWCSTRRIPEYLDDARRYDSIAWLARFPNLLISRTFSKAYGLAGSTTAQPPDGHRSEPVRQPFNVSSIALAAGRSGARRRSLLAPQRRAESRRHGSRSWQPAQPGARDDSSSGNFVTIRVGDAARVNQRLLEQGVIVRPIGGYGLPGVAACFDWPGVGERPFHRRAGRSALA